MMITTLLSSNLSACMEISTKMTTVDDHFHVVDGAVHWKVQYLSQYASFADIVPSIALLKRLRR